MFRGFLYSASSGPNGIVSYHPQKVQPQKDSMAQGSAKIIRDSIPYILMKYFWKRAFIETTTGH
jgi:hypothetical protein